jgi:hypothetical protein
MRLATGPTRALKQAMTGRGFLFALCAVAVLAFVPRAAHAQNPDALPSLDESAPNMAPEPPPSAPAPVVQVVRREPDRRGLLPVRAQRRLALLGEVGWNGIAGFGPMLVFHPVSRIALDLGLGLSLMGWKTGLRARYNFMDGPVTPFIGAGFMGAAGLGDSPIPINDNDKSRETVNIKVLPSAWVQAVGGVDWTSPSGFTLLGSVGYAWLLSHDPVQVTSGTPTKDQQRAFDLAFRSNIVATIALGYAFR